ncbi:MAG: 16S rRNA (uracil(1498)-N(3))-methyltransferase [Bacteroidales bacterium]|nr:16S rRNA (uracil(1498)-N(3))-methyltransferase [Bacteroidales bacterium]
MNLFYSPCIIPPSHHFEREESTHIIRVLRLKEGDQIHLTDGKGALYLCDILVADPKRCEVSLHASLLLDRIAPPLHIAIAPTKNTNRFEWFLEKSTEIGIDTITPLICSRSERTGIKTERFQKVLIAAMKQSIKAWLPELREPVSFNEIIHKPFMGQKFIAYCETGAEELLQKSFQKGIPALILIGPEGDFSPGEVAEAIREGFIPVSLGKSRLRTETAGVVACVMMQIVNSDNNHEA